MARRSGNRDDRPPYSRLFIVCSKDVTNDDLKSTFSDYGELIEAKIVKDRNSGESKGVGYVQFKLTSQAAEALEAENGKIMRKKPVKVLVASDNRDEENNDDDEKYRRLFIVVPKEIEESDIRNIFSEYGKVVHVTIPKDRNTQEAKGVAFVKFSKFSECAKAYENADKKYKAIFAEPRNKNKSNQDFGNAGPNNFGNAGSNNYMMPMPMLPPSSARMSERFTHLKVTTHPLVTQQQMGRLFDVVPNFEFCQFEVRTERGNEFIVKYSYPESAAHAREKLHNFEYPPGKPIYVESVAFYGQRVQNYENNAHAKNPANIDRLMATISDAASLLQSTSQFSRDSSSTNIDLVLRKIKEAANIYQGGEGGGSSQDLCDVPLPPLQPMLSIDTEGRKRCFVVFNPRPPPLNALRDVFCRFGGLIDVYTMPNRSFGYVKYATVESADDAIKTLHGATVCGVRLKVLEAEERGDNSQNDTDMDQNQRKRPKFQ